MVRLTVWLIGGLGTACMVAALMALAWGGRLPQDEIVFSASFNYDGSDLAIYRMDVRNRLTVKLSRGYITSGSLDLNPVWSPSGDRIAFVGKLATETHIYTMNPLGGDRTRLSSLAQYNFDPRWSPDGQWLAYVSTNDYVTFQLMLTHIPTRTTTRLVTRNGTAIRPAWSPDSRQIAFMGMQPRADLYTVDITQGETRLQLSTGDSSEDPAWSPDGRQIAFVAYDLNTAHTNLYTFSLADASLHPVATSRADEQYPTWSPDGRYLLYTTADNTRLARFDTQTGSTLELPMNSGYIFGTPHWSANGRYIFYSAYAQSFGNSGLYRVNADACLHQAQSCIPERLTAALGDYSVPDWRPEQP